MIALALCGGLVGCAPAPRPAAPVQQGYANLNVLVRQSPGWQGVGQYDAALARLGAAARSLPSAGQPDQKIATLPALPAPPALAGSAALAKTAGIGQRLKFVQSDLVQSLQDRREMARADQLRGQQEIWRREARQKFPVPTRTTEISSDLTLQILQLNVDALTQTLIHWDSVKPPAPRLDTLRQAVETDRSRLEALIQARIQARDAARSVRLEAIRHLRAARLAYVQARRDTLAGRLEGQDAQIVSAQQSRLTAQRQTLLMALASAQPMPVPTVGDGGAISLPRGPGAARATLSAASLRAARAKLTAQRQRWIQYLYDDTRASALDAAAKRHWVVAFGPPTANARDMTADLAKALRQAAGR